MAWSHQGSIVSTFDKDPEIWFGTLNGTLCGTTTCNLYVESYNVVELH